MSPKHSYIRLEKTVEGALVCDELRGVFVERELSELDGGVLQNTEVEIERLNLLRSERGVFVLRNLERVIRERVIRERVIRERVVNGLL
ncbi:hypothetical protein TRAPUB_5759 [Trametes pubescens]|uniref:Uncharacterized protein n=1 Tax=Trametes pubescens TaxID=154538 RepID=A0A1M2V7Q9_TRAPU|nr:hypothetical protein TRAPUB_5759 [Trametes pubescens]